MRAGLFVTDIGHVELWKNEIWKLTIQLNIQKQKEDDQNLMQDPQRYPLTHHIWIVIVGNSFFKNLIYFWLWDSSYSAQAFSSRGERGLLF